MSFLTLRGELRKTSDPTIQRCNDPTILLNPHLVGVELVIPPFLRHEVIVLPAFHDLPLFDDQDLVGPADGAETVGDDEGRPVLQQPG